MADRMKHLSQLLANPDAKVRLYALDEIIRNAHRVTESQLSDVLATASNDGDKSVSMRASEGLAILEQRGFKQLRRARDRRADLSALGLSWEEHENAREAAYRILDMVVETLEDLAGDMSAKRSMAALDALGMFRYPPSLGPMFKALSRRDTSTAAAQAIAQYPEDAALPLFKKLLDNPTFPEAKAVALEGLGKLQGAESFALIQAHKGNSDTGVVAAVARAMGFRSEREAENLLIPLLKSSDQDVQASAVDSLGMVGEGPAAAALHSCFVDSGDSKVQAKILTALGLIHRKESIEYIAKGLRSQDGRVRANAVESLASYDLREPEAVRYFEPLLRDENNRAAANAILALYSYDRDQAVAALQKMLKAKEERKRSSAAFIIGELQDPLLMQGLITMINTEQDRDVLTSALRSIGRIRNPEMKAGISKLCRHPNDLIRGRAIQVFAGMSGISEIKILENYFRDESSPTVRATIVTSMGRICDINHLSFLKSKLRDRDDRIVANAIESLDHVAALENAALIDPFLHHSSYRVQANALVALWHAGNLKAGDTLADLLDTTDDDQLASGIHAAKAFAYSISPLGMRQYPMLRSSLKSVYQTLSTVGTTAWDMFKTSRFYQDVIMGETDEGPSPEEIAKDAVSPDLQPGNTGSLPVITASGQIKPLVDKPAEKQGETKGEIALVAALGLMLKGRSEKAQEFLAKAPDEDEVGALLAYTDRRAASMTGAAPSNRELEDPPGESPFLPVHAAVIDDAKAHNDFAGVLQGYFGLYRGQLSLLMDLVQLGESVLEKGDEAAAAKVAKELAQALKGDATLHRTVGERHFTNRIYRSAYPQLLRAWAHSPDDPELLLKLASVTARIRKPRLARQMLKVLLDDMDVDETVRKKAEGLAQILAGK